MKKVNKLISTIMAVIMFITATPVLQAADFAASLDKQQFNELKRQISSSVTAEIAKVKPIIYEGIPDVKTIKERYATSRKNYEQNLQEFSKQNIEPDVEEYERYVEFLKEEAKQRIKTDSRYDGFKTQKEKEQVAFYTVLLEEIKKSDEERSNYYTNMVGDICVGGIIAILLGITAWATGASTAAILIAGAIGGAIGIFIMFSSVSPSRPVFNPSLFSEELIAVFLVNPFSNLALFDKRASDSEMFYNKSVDCAQVLYDAVDIEYYTSLNPSIENMRARLYTQTIDWHELTTEQRADYIHNLAKRLRTEAK